MIDGVKIENGSCDHNHAPFGEWFVIRSLNLIHSTCVQIIAILALAFLEISSVAPKFKLGHVTLSTPHLRVICHSCAGN